MKLALATQGLYLLGSSGQVVARNFLPGMNVAERQVGLDKIHNNLGDRPYFQTAKSFKRAFVSDIFQSVFNHNATFAICVPIIKDGNFEGLLFSACQVGQWKTPITESAKISKGLAAYILDGQGMVAIPPNGEFQPAVSPKLGESPDYGLGYDYLELKILSRKDRIINRLAENIVPVESDDDIVPLHCRAADRVTGCAGASLSGTAGAGDRAVRARRRHRSRRTCHGSMAVRATRPAICDREPPGRRHQYRY